MSLRLESEVDWIYETCPFKQSGIKTIDFVGDDAGGQISRASFSSADNLLSSGIWRIVAPIFAKLNAEIVALKIKMRLIPEKFDEIAGFKVRDLIRDFQGMRTNRRPVVGGKHQDSQFSTGEILLIFEVLIAGDHCIELRFGSRDQLAVLQLTPTSLLSCHHGVIRQEFSQRTRNACVQKNFHAASFNASRLAYSKTATACSRLTSGKQSRYSVKLNPLSRFVKRLSTGTRVPRKQGAPLIRSGSDQIGTSGGKFVIIPGFIIIKIPFHFNDGK